MFERRVESDDGAGNVEAEWSQVGEAVAARIQFLKGGETAVAERLEGRRPAVITVRASAQSKSVTPEFRIRNVRSGLAFNVTAPTPDERGAYIDILCVAGGADG